MRRLGLLIGSMIALLLATPMAAGAASQVSGDAAYPVGVQCPDPPAGYEDFDSYPGLLLSGSLDGCLYTKANTPAKETPSGVYLESGEEVFVGSLNDGPVGTFTTTYKFQSKFDLSTGLEIFGRCHHPIVEGSGTGGLEGATGRLDFKDIIGNPVTYVYRGHIVLG